MFFFLPIAFLAFIFFILFLPILFILGYFHVVTVGFEKLGFSSETTILLLLAILIGSSINIPLGRQKLVQVEEPVFFGLFRQPRIKSQGIAVNLGGVVIPVLISLYFLYLGWRQGFSLEPILIAIILMIIIAKLSARIIPGRGIVLPFFIPPLFAVIFALILSPGFAAPTAFISGVLGTLIGADLLNLRKVQKISPGFLSIGGAGVFDGIFLVGMVSALLAGF